MTEEKSAPASASILVVGGGISGLTTALEAAEVGYEVFVVEQNPYLGGRVAQLNQYFPKLCPPTCGLEINFRRIKDNPNIKVFTLAEIEKVEGTPGNYNVTIKSAPRYVNENCVACNDCVAACPVERDNDFNFNMDKTKAIYRPFDMAFPMRYVIDPAVCKGPECGKCVEACKYNAIELQMEPKTLNLNVGAIVWSTGWTPYDAARIDNLGFGKYPNIVTNMMMERLAAAAGGTTWQGIAAGGPRSFLGYPVELVAGSVFPKTDANSAVYCILGDLTQSSTLGDRRSMSMRITETGDDAKYDRLSVISSARWDINNHDLGTATVAGPVTALIGAAS